MSEERDWENLMNNNSNSSKFVYFLSLILMILGVLAGVSVLIMLVWNWTIPSIFGSYSINIFQAFGLYVLGTLISIGGNYNG